MACPHGPPKALKRFRGVVCLRKRGQLPPFAETSRHDTAQARGPMLQPLSLPKLPPSALTPVYPFNRTRRPPASVVFRREPSVSGNTLFSVSGTTPSLLGTWKSFRYRKTRAPFVRTGAKTQLWRVFYGVFVFVYTRHDCCYHVGKGGVGNRGRSVRYGFGPPFDVSSKSW